MRDGATVPAGPANIVMLAPALMVIEPGFSVTRPKNAFSSLVASVAASAEVFTIAAAEASRREEMEPPEVGAFPKFWTVSVCPFRSNVPRTVRCASLAICSSPSRTSNAPSSTTAWFTATADAEAERRVVPSTTTSVQLLSEVPANTSVPGPVLLILPEAAASVSVSPSGT